MEFVIPPPPERDPRRHLRFRDTAVDVLRRTPAFANVSRRLLTDLMDVAEHHDLRPTPQGRSFEISGIALLAVLEGAVVVERTVAPTPPPAPPPGAPPTAPFVSTHGLPPAAPPPQPAPPPLLARLEPGVYLGNDQRWEKETNPRIRTAENEGAYVIVISRTEIIRWLRASAALLHSLGFPKGYQVLITEDELFPDPPERGLPRGR